MDEQKAFMVKVPRYGCYYFDCDENVIYFMLYVGKKGHDSIGCKKNELGQYEKFCWTELTKTKKDIIVTLNILTED